MSLNIIKKPILAIDIDEVLAQFIPILAVYHNEIYGSNYTAESFVSYEFHRIWGGTVLECNAKVDSFFESKYFKNDIIPVPGAKEALLILKEDFELHIVTARQHRYETQTREWIQKHFPNIFTTFNFGNHYSTVGKSRSKSQMCTEIGAIMLVDDSALYAQQCSLNGIPVILFGDYAWNRDFIIEDNTEISKLVTRAFDWDTTIKIIYEKFSSETNNITTTENEEIDDGFIIAAIQMCSTDIKLNNLKSIERLVSRAVHEKGAQICCLPECCIFIGSNSEETVANAECLDGPSMTALCIIAKNHSVWLSIGGISESRLDLGLPERVSNVHVIINPEGQIENPTYRKIHLFDSHFSGLFESKNTVPGVSPSVVNTGFVNLGLSICYDLRFPELYRLLNNSEIVLIPSAFTKDTGKAHWEILLRARAIENQCYIVAAAQCGRHNLTRVSHGQSMIVDPWGKIISSCVEYDSMLDTDHEANAERWEGFCVAKFNRKLLENIREKMPVLSHRRNDIYNATK